MGINNIIAEHKMLTTYLAKPYEEYTIDELANKYCEAVDTKNTFNQDIYLSALILRFNYKINDIYRKCKNVSGFDYESAYEVLVDCILVAMDYRAWQKDDSLNAQQCIQQTIGSRGAAAVLYRANLNMSKANSNMMSLDALMEDNENGETWLDTISYNPMEETEAEIFAKEIVQSYINKNKIVEAILLDTIAWNDCNKITTEKQSYIDADGNEQKFVKSSSEFSPRLVVKALNELSEEYEQAFCKKYTIALDALKLAINKIKVIPNAKKYKFIEKTLNDLRANSSYYGLALE